MIYYIHTYDHLAIFKIVKASKWNILLTQPFVVHTCIPEFQERENSVFGLLLLLLLLLMFQAINQLT